MTTLFTIKTTSHFDRLFKKLAHQHSDLPGYLETIRTILQTDPHNRSGKHPIKKLSGIRPATPNTDCAWVGSVFATILKGRQSLSNVVRYVARTPTTNGFQDPGCFRCAGSAT